MTAGVAAAAGTVSARQNDASLAPGVVACMLWILVVPLALPALAAASPAAGALRMIYPAYVLLFAVLLTKRRSALYPAFIVAAFAFAPFLRRLADFRAGYSTYSFILLAPYVGLLPTIPALLRRAFGRPDDLRMPFTVIVVCVTYASLISLLKGEIISALFEAAKWILPIALCALIMERRRDADATRATLVRALCMILPTLSFYGLFQFVRAPPWDVFWMLNVDNPTFGSPEPFGIRVYSMLNSPFSLGVFCSYATILLAAEGLLPFAAAVTGVPVLGLSLVRTAWISLGAGLVVLLLFAKPSRQIAIVLCVLGLGLSAGFVIDSSFVPNEVRLVLNERFQTFSNVGNGTDVSAQERLNLYSNFYDRLSQNPLGEGFGVNASTINAQAKKQDTGAIDSAVLEAYLTFGIVTGTLFFTAFAAIVAATLRMDPRIRKGFGGEYGVVFGMLAIMPLGDSSIGETGALAWTVIGVLLAKAGERQPAGQSVSAGSNHAEGANA